VAHRSSGLRARPRGLLGHVGAGRPRTGERLVRQPRQLPEALEAGDVTAFPADLRTSTAAVDRDWGGLGVSALVRAVTAALFRVCEDSRIGRGHRGS